MANKQQIETIRPGDRGAAVEDVQQRLALLGFLKDSQVTGTFDEETAAALESFMQKTGIPAAKEVDSKTWSALVDATFHLGDRTLYLRMPHFHGHDVLELQQALGALGFFVGENDAIFGAHTEHALRKFQANLALPSDGIAGAYTYAALHNLEHSWVGKGALHATRPLGFARAADVLESNAICLFGTCDFTRSVASRMSNLALATNPASKIVSADALSVNPDAGMLLVEVALNPEPQTHGKSQLVSMSSTQRVDPSMPVVAYSDDETLVPRIAGAVQAAHTANPAHPRICVVLPGTSWEEAGPSRTAQHFAITLLDSFCSAL